MDRPPSERILRCMSITAHAILLLLLPLATLVIVVAWQRRSPSTRQLALAGLLSCLAMALAFSFNQHLCVEGTPLNQWLITGMCMFLTLAVLESARRRRLLAAVLFVGMIRLSCHFTDVVHSPGWTGNPHWTGTAPAMLRSLPHLIQIPSTDSGNPDADYPAGWLRDLPVSSENQPFLTCQRPMRREIHRAWHTRLTGLYRYVTIPQDFWYPGGPFARAFAQVQLRDRPTQ